MRLDGLRIVDLTQRLPGPYATQLLSDLGADVIKVEPPGGGDAGRAVPPMTDAGDGIVFDASNRGKRSVVLNLKSEGGYDAFCRLVEQADAVVEGFRPGVADRLGVGPDGLRSINEDLVYCSLSGYGQDGPYSDRVGHDLTYLGTAGILDMTRTSDDERPRIPGAPIADVAGGLFAAFSIVSGLLAREHGAGGGFFDVSMTAMAASFAQADLSMALAGRNPRPGETLLTGGEPWYDVYEAADGRYLTIAAIEAPFWERLCRLVDREEWIDVHGTTDSAERTALREGLSALFAERPREAWLDLLADEDTTVGTVNTMAEAVDDPHFRKQGLFVDDDGSLPRIGFPALIDGERPVNDHPSPGLGEHTAAVLRECGYDDEELEQLHEDGAIEGSET